MGPERRVFDVASARLHANGLALTTLDDVARGADVDGGDLRARFGDMEGLMRALALPLLSRLQETVASAATADLRQPRQLRTVIERYLDALVAHRLLVGVILGDPTAASSESVRLVRAAIRSLRDELAGGSDSDLDHRIRAASALGAVQAAALELADMDPTKVRAVITDAAVAILLPY